MSEVLTDSEANQIVIDLWWCLCDVDAFKEQLEKDIVWNRLQG